MSVEDHPFEPFLPPGARMLMLGTFPPSQKRWSMCFYYPNFSNDMWRIVGCCFFADKDHFVDREGKTFRLEALKAFLSEKGIALYDTATRVVRTKNTASDKDLQIVEPTDIAALLRRLPECRTIVTAGQLATTTACRQFGVAEPKVGEGVEFEFEGRRMCVWRMPSSSRAYPMAVGQKAEFYRRVFDRL